MTASASRVSSRRLAWIDARLSARDRSVVDELNRVRLATGKQLEALCFAELSGHSKTVVRGRVLSRLADWRVIVPLDRRIGGAQRGSTSTVYCLGPGARGLLGSTPAAAAPKSLRFMAHSLAVTQLYVDVVEASQELPDRAKVSFAVEPASWAPDGLGSFLKPDAYLRLVTDDLTDHWWVEIDLGTESLPTIEHKLRTYVDFVDRGGRGPADVIPRVLISLPARQRLTQVSRVIQRLHVAPGLFVATTHREAALTLVGCLRE